jgi:hypothetical protein
MSRTLFSLLITTSVLLASAGSAFPCGANSKETLSFEPACKPSLIMDTAIFPLNLTGDPLEVLGMAGVMHKNGPMGPVFATCVINKAGNNSIQVGPAGQTLTRDAACLDVTIVEPVCNPAGKMCTCPGGIAIPFNGNNVMQEGRSVMCARCKIDLSNAGLKSGDLITTVTYVNLDGGTAGKECNNGTCDCSGDGVPDPNCRTRIFTAPAHIPPGP